MSFAEMTERANKALEILANAEKRSDQAYDAAEQVQGLLARMAPHAKGGEPVFVFNITRDRLDLLYRQKCGF